MKENIIEWEKMKIMAYDEAEDIALWANKYIFVFFSKI